jgi:hypothetical protein
MASFMAMSTPVSILGSAKILFAFLSLWPKEAEQIVYN